MRRDWPARRPNRTGGRRAVRDFHPFGGLYAVRDFLQLLDHSNAIIDGAIQRNAASESLADGFLDECADLCLFGRGQLL
jgi:hypothetical protein